MAAASFALGLHAQSSFVVSPRAIEGEEIMLLGEKMSENRKFVVGESQAFNTPAIWNTETNEVQMFVFPDSTWVEDPEQPYYEYMLKTGSFHSVNNNGAAVGSLTTADFVTHPILAYAGNGTEYITLYEDPSDVSAEAYDISEDGNTIVGFHFDAAWITHACVWSGDGATRIDLPFPTEEELGFAIDYVGARWISADGSVILGYAQDFYTGAWVAVTWRLKEGQYVVEPIANNYFQTTYFDEEGNWVVPGENPYVEFEPVALSANGEWVSLSVVELYDPTDWDYTPVVYAARMNILTGAFEMLALEEEYNELLMFGIADNGRCAGRFSGLLDPMTWDQEVSAVVWYEGSNVLTRLMEFYPTDPYFSTTVASSLSCISADGEYVMGYAADQDTNETSFYVSLDLTSCVEQGNTEINVFPNPAAAQINVVAENEINTISVINMMGQVVFTQEVNAIQTSINAQELPAGVYFLDIVSGNSHSVKRVSVVK